MITVILKGLLSLIKNSNLINQQNSDNDANDNNTTLNKKQLEQINEYGSITQTKGNHVIYCLTIIGQIEGHSVLPSDNKTTKYEHVIPQLIEIEEDPNIEGVLITLNTCGGDVEAGLAIAELISGMSKPSVSLVLGGGHSIGVPLAVSSDYSFIVPSATMMIHPVRMTGLVIGVPQAFDYFEKMQDRITKFVVTNSCVKEEVFTNLMMNTKELATDVGSVLDGPAAVGIGLIDELGSLSSAIKKLYELIDKNMEDSSNGNKKKKSHKQQTN